MRLQTQHFLLLLTTLIFLAAPALAETDGEISSLESPATEEGLAVAEEAIPMRITAVHGRKFGYIQALEQLVSTIAEESEGRIKVELLIGGEFGSEAEALKKQIRRKIEGGLTSSTTMAYSLPAFRLLTLPLLFTAPSHVKNFIDSPLDLAIRKTAHSKKLEVLGYGSFGFYGLLAFEQDEDDEDDPDSPPTDNTSQPSSNNIENLLFQELVDESSQPTKTYIGLSVRAPVDHWMSRIHKALSIKQVTVPVADLPDAIESGWVEGIISTPETLTNTPYPKTASHYFDIRQQHGWSIFTVNKSWFDDLPADLQQIVAEAVAAISKKMQNIAFYNSYLTRAAWAAENWPQIVPSEPAELEAAFRPLVFKTARRLERKLGVSGAIRELWEQNRTPQSNYWPISLEDDAENPPLEMEDGQTVIPRSPASIEIGELMKQNLPETSRENAVRQ
jgi:TRAP-type C4-dicarboxylate transport system substrate-binding protein